MLKGLENTNKQMKKGILEFCILLVIKKEKLYASDILKKLKKADMHVGEGTLYPLLSRLKKSGLVKFDIEESKIGPPRKYYSLTKKGRETLDLLTQKWEKFHNSIFSLMDKKCNILCKLKK